MWQYIYELYSCFLSTRQLIFVIIPGYFSSKGIALEPELNYSKPWT